MKALQLFVCIIIMCDGCIHSCAASTAVHKDSFKLSSSEMMALKYVNGGHFEARDCLEVLEKWGNTKQDGWYIVRPHGNVSHIKVYCDLTTEHGGWTVIQHNNGKASMSHNWEQYKRGFMNSNKSFWLGNENIFMLINPLTTPVMLRIDVTDKDGIARSIVYDSITMSNEASNYKLCVREFNLTQMPMDPLGLMQFDPPCAKFSTPDRDNDAALDANCAEMLGAGMWHGNCTSLNVNGHTPQVSSAKRKNKKRDVNDHSFIKGMWWYGWNKQLMQPLQSVSMKIRPVQPKDCSAVRKFLGISKHQVVEGVYTIQMYPKFPSVRVRCHFDQEGDWIVIQRRIDGSVDFDRDGNDYIKGFGDLEGEFWWGMSNIFAHSNHSTLKIELWDWENDYEYIEYESFEISPQGNIRRTNPRFNQYGNLNTNNGLHYSPNKGIDHTNYITKSHFHLRTEEFTSAYNLDYLYANFGQMKSGNGSDCFTASNGYRPHGWNQFSTRSSGSYTSRAQRCKGGWWYPQKEDSQNYCKCALNGLNSIPEYLKNRPDASIRWPGVPYKIHATKIMIRPKYTD